MASNNLIFWLISGSFLISTITFAVVTADTEIHWDGNNYYRGFLSLQQLDYEATYMTMTRPGEIYLQGLYAIIGQFFQPSRAEQVIILNSVIFSLTYFFACYFYVFHVSNLQSDKVTTFFLILLMSQPGLPLQLARQSIAFAFLILIISLITLKFNKKISAILAPLLALLTHRFSIFVAIYLVFLNNWKALLWGLLIAFMSIHSILHADLFGLSTYNMHFNVARYKSAAMFTNPYHIYLLIITILIVANYRVSFANIMPLFLFILFLNLFPSHLFKRLFFGVDLFMIPLAMGFIINISRVRFAYSKALFQMKLIIMWLAKLTFLHAI